MADWSVWLIFAGIALLVELSTGTFYLLILAIAMCLGSAAALLHLSLEWQLLSVAVASVVGIVGLRRYKKHKYGNKKLAEDPDFLLDIGQTVHVTHWQKDGEYYRAEVKYRGALWQAQMPVAFAAHDGVYTITAMQGSILLVKPVITGEGEK